MKVKITSEQFDEIVGNLVPDDEDSADAIADYIEKLRKEIFKDE